MTFILHLQVKFSIKFVEGWPVIGRVRFCFAQAPTVNMTARTIYKKGVDVSLIPGLANWVVNFYFTTTSSLHFFYLTWLPCVLLQCLFYTKVIL